MTRHTKRQPPDTITGQSFVDWCRSDQARRWQAGEKVGAEEYFAAFADALADRESALLLIYGEVLLRERLGELPSIEEFERRFPHFANDLRIQFQLHSALGPASTTTGPRDLEHVETELAPAHEGLELLDEIGHGGMGVVMRGHDHAFDRELAVKVMRNRSSEQPGGEDRFLSEARISGRLQHPGIVPVHQIGRLSDGRPFFTMKLIRGRTMAELLGERPDPSHDRPRFLKVFEQVCQTVAYAHEHGVIHRDIKPANVMVGRFGEVQVMDWGLAKTLGVERRTSGSHATEVIDTVDTAVSDSATQFGQVLGTPGYMSPEQGRGEVERIDARSDVFGLGALLCEILTGDPPFVGLNRIEVIHQTAAEELGDASERLENCGADGELVALARRCLAPKPEERPADAKAVATALADHTAGAEARLKHAELDRAAAEARATSERRARRLTAGLAAAGLLLVVSLAGGAVWYQRDRSARAAEQARRSTAVSEDVRAALREANDLGARSRDLTGDPERWKTTLAAARTAVDRAQRLADAEPSFVSSDLRAEIDSSRKMLDLDEQDRQFVARLDTIRLLPTETEIGATMLDRMDFAERYRTAFKAYGMNSTSNSPAQSKESLNQRPAAVRAAILSSLDDWLAELPSDASSSEAQWLRDVLNASESDTWLRKIRDMRFQKNFDRAELARLADETDIRARSPSALALVTRTLYAAGDRERAIEFLRRAQWHHADDFWINFNLGHLLYHGERFAEAARYYQAARAKRPNDPRLMVNLGNTLYRCDEPAAAEALQRQALTYDPKLMAAHVGLGCARRAQNDAAGAAESFRKAIALEARNPIAYAGLGNALNDLRDRPGAIAAYRKAVEFRPRFANAQFQLGSTLLEERDLPGAVTALRLATELESTYAYAFFRLGFALQLQGNHAEAADAYRRAIALDPKHALSHYNLGNALNSLKDYPGATAAYRRAIELNPKHVSAHVNLGSGLQKTSGQAEAETILRRAIDLDSRNVLAHVQMGLLLSARGDKRAAAAEFQQAVEINPNYVAGYSRLGDALWESGDLPGAEAAFRKAAELKPDDAQAICNIGLVLRDAGRFTEALDLLRRGHDLGQRQRNWKSPSADWLKECERLMTVEKNIAAAQAGTASPADQFAVAELLARYRKHYVTATWLAAQALESEPTLADNRAANRRVEAARWAIRAAAGEGKDEAPDVAEVTRLREQARNWLRDEFKTRGPASAKSWLTDSSFATVRDDDAIFRLTEAERAAWRALWDEVRAANLPPTK